MTLCKQQVGLVWLFAINSFFAISLVHFNLLHTCGFTGKGYFDRAKVIYFVCVWLHILRVLNSSVSLVRRSGVCAFFRSGHYVCVCVLARDIASDVCGKSSGQHKTCSCLCKL